MQQDPRDHSQKSVCFSSASASRFCSSGGHAERCVVAVGVRLLSTPAILSLIGDEIASMSAGNDNDNKNDTGPASPVAGTGAGAWTAPSAPFPSGAASSCSCSLHSLDMHQAHTYSLHHHPNYVKGWLCDCSWIAARKRRVAAKASTLAHMTVWL